MDRVPRAGAVAGVLAGLLGVGGGLVLVAALAWLLPVIGTSSACGVAIGLASAVGYALHAPAGALPAYSIGYVYLPAAIGVAMASVLAAPYGMRLAHRLDGTSLKRVFAGFLAAVAVSLLAGF